MADNVISYKIQADGTAIRDVAREADNLKAALKNASDPKEINRLNKELNATNDQLKSLNKTADQFNLGANFEDIYGDVKPLTGRLGELEDRMYELALAGKANSDEFKALQNEASTMRKTIIDVDKQVDLLAENKGMSVFAAGFGEVADSFMRLDFESAAVQAGNLAKASSQISFGTAVKSLKNLGKTFASLGKALLTNPLFLIVGVVGAIIAAIVKLMDEMGILEDIFNAIGDAIGWVIQQFKDLLDWMGLTNYAAEDAAERQAKAAKKRADAQERSSNRIIQGLDNEIRLIEANGEVTDEEFEKILAIEAEKRKELAKTAEARFMEADAAAKAAILKGDLDKEELRDLRDKREEAMLAYKQSLKNIEIAEVEADTKRRKRRTKRVKAERDAYREIMEYRKEIDQQIQEESIAMIEDEMERERQMAIFKENMAFKEIEKEKLTNEQIEALEVQHKFRLEQIEQDYQDKLKAKKDARLQKEKEEQQTLADQIEADMNAELEREEYQFQRLLEIQNTARENEVLAVQQAYVKERELAEGNAELMKAIKEEEKAEIAKINKKYADEEMKTRQAVADFALSNASNLFTSLGQFAEEGSAASKVFALSSIVADTAKALMKAVPVALEASGAYGPAAPAVFAATLAGIAGTIVGAAANAKQVLSSAPGKGGGGGGGAVSPPPAPNVGTPQPEQTPDVIFGNENEGVEQTASSTNEEKVYVVDYTDIEDTGNEMNKLQKRVQLG